MKHTYIYILLIFALTRCAQITPLTGGKKDETPPKAISYAPANASINFNSKQITILFNEFIVLKDITNQFIITPQTKELPDIQAKGKLLKITFNEALLPNTTYKLAFGNAISDLHEGNPSSNFEYVFSTGNVIDSLKLTGTVLTATNKKPVGAVLIGLYNKTASDSVIYKEKPLYISYTGADGKFNFSYLPDKPFKLVAIDDANKNLMYDGSDEQLAYPDSLVNPHNNQQIDLLMFKESPTKLFIKKIISSEYGKAIIVYNKPNKEISTVSWTNNEGVYRLNDSQDSLTIYYTQAFDSLNTIIHRTTKNDTVLIKIPTKAEYEKLKKTNRLKFLINTNLTSIYPYFQTPSLNLNFPFDIEKINKEKIMCYKTQDSIKTKQPITIKKNDLRVNAFNLTTTIEKETNYQFTIGKGAFIDSTSRSNDSISFVIKTNTPDDYALLNLKLLFPKKENYLVLLLNDKDQIVEKKTVQFSLSETNEKLFTYSNLIPGNYFIKVVEDANKNNAFDVGDYFKKSQPEIIYLNNKPIKLLAGWEIENEWKIN